MKGIVIIELKGFTEIASSLVYRMEKIELKDTQIKLKYRNIIDSIIFSSTSHFNSIETKKIGGDTWVVVYANLEIAIKSAAHILQITYNQVVQTGLYYLKPVVSVGEADPVFEGERFIDRETTSVYRVADAGNPFSLYIINPGRKQENLLELTVNDKLFELNEQIRIKELDWRKYIFGENELGFKSTFYLSSLLHENDMAFFESSSESFEKFIELQNQSKFIYAYGGPIRFNNSVYDRYAESIFKLFNTKDCKCYVLTYIDPKNNSLNSYYWLRLCQIFIRDYGGKFIFSFYEVDTSKVKPLAYHIYDHEYIQLILRNYNPGENDVIMNSSILMRNKMLAGKYVNEFLENFRKVQNETPGSIDAYLSDINVTQKNKDIVDNYIEKLRNG
jgi:hypothetical protein